MEYYSCPTCGTHNEDYVKYCKRCGAWLVGDAKKVVIKKSKALKNTVSTLLFLVILIGSLVFFLKPNLSESFLSSKNEIVFDDVNVGDQFKVSQFVISELSSSSPKVAAELYAMKDSELPLRIQAVFFDVNGKRLGIATSRVGHQLLANSTTTIVFDIEDGNDIKHASNVRIEIVNESPLETLQSLL